MECSREGRGLKLVIANNWVIADLFKNYLEKITSFSFWIVCLKGEMKTVSSEKMIMIMIIMMISLCNP